MNIAELKSKIILNQIPDILVFTGPEVEIMNFYIKKIEDILKYKTHKLDSVEDAIKLSSGNSIFKIKKLFIITDDNTFLKQDKAWSNLGNLLAGNKIILKYHNYDTRLSFWKTFKNSTTVFERLSESVLVKHLVKDFGMSENNCLTLARNCSNDYFRCKLELDKILNYAKSKNIDIDNAFEKCYNDGTLCFDDNLDIFDFINAILVKNFINALNLMVILKNKNEPILKIIGILYTSFKNVLIAQTISSGKNIQQNAGINYYSYAKAKDVAGYYSNNEIEFILYKLMLLEQDIKTGNIDNDLVFDYLIFCLYRGI